METDENENTTVQKLWDSAKAVLRGKYITIQAFLKKLEKSQMHKLLLHLKELEKEQQIKPKPSRRWEIIKIRVEINELETKRTIEQINETRASSFKEWIRLINPWPDLSERKEKGHKYIKSWMKDEKSQPTPKKYKQL